MLFVESLKTLVTVADNAGRGFVIKTIDNTVVEPQFVIVVIVSDKARNIELQRLRFTFIDNDGRTWQFIYISMLTFFCFKFNV